MTTNHEVLVCVREPRLEDANEHGQVEAWNVDLGKFEKRFWFDFAGHPLWSEEQRAEIIRKWPKWKKISVAQGDGTKWIPFKDYPADCVSLEKYKL